MSDEMSSGVSGDTTEVPPGTATHGLGAGAGTPAVAGWELSGAQKTGAGLTGPGTQPCVGWVARRSEAAITAPYS